MYTDCSVWLWISSQHHKSPCSSHFMNHPKLCSHFYINKNNSVFFQLTWFCCTWWVQLRLQSLLGLIYICMCIFILQVGTNVHKEASSCRIWKVKHFRLESANTSMYIMTVFLKTWSRNYNRKWKRKVDTEIKAIWNAIEVTLLTNFRITWACTGLHAPVGIVSHMHIYELQQAPFGSAIVSRYM